MVKRKMKKLLMFLTVILILTGCRQLPGDDDYSTSIYYVPHPDDETLSMGPSILHNIEKDMEVIVVLLSKGRASKVFHSVNKKLEQEHKPHITLEQFGLSREAEFRRAAAALGVKEENTYVYDVEDGAFSVDEVKPIIEAFSEQYPDALHNVMSYNDTHRDHATTGESLRALMKEKKVKNGLYHLPIQRHKKMISRGSYPVPVDFEGRYEDALNVYANWAPDEGFYHIGQSSVKSYFERATASKKSRWH